MIKIEGKRNIVKAEIMGDEVTVLSELTYAAKHIHKEIEKVRGRKVADEDMKDVFKLAIMSEEELDKECEAKKQLLKESVWEFLDDLLTPGGAK